MREATNLRRRSARRAMYIMGLCLAAAAGGTTIVAAGGVEAIRNWFATAVVVEPDGTKTEVEVTPDGMVYLGEDYGVMAPPDQVDHLKGRTITIYTAPADYVKPSGLTAEQEREQLRKNAEGTPRSNK